jgi:hypothetical protein
MININSKESMTTVQDIKISKKFGEVVLRCPKLYSRGGLAGAERVDVSHIIS